jgi:hypothetical protein
VGSAACRASPCAACPLCATKRESDGLGAYFALRTVWYLSLMSSRCPSSHVTLSTTLLVDRPIRCIAGCICDRIAENFRRLPLIRKVAIILRLYTRSPDCDLIRDFSFLFDSGLELLVRNWEERVAKIWRAALSRGSFLIGCSRIEYN